MKRAIFVLFLFIATAALGDERAEKRQLASELLEVIDAKALTQTSFENVMTAFGAMIDESRGGAEIPEEYRVQFEEEQRKERERVREFQERMFARFDYTKYFDETYVPLLESQFTAGELRQLIDFFKTKHGQKFAKLLPRLGVGTNMRMIQDAAVATQKEMEKAEAAKYPWRETMADMRSLATAVEARATDLNEYAKVAFDELEALIAPTYIRTVPKVDSWGTPFLYVSDGEHYRFVSAGADKHFEWSSRHLDLTTTEPRFPESLDADIIFQDGNFLQSPKAAQ